MALFKILQGLDSKLNSSTNPVGLTEGYCYFTIDNNMFYVDHKNKDGTLVRSPLNAQNANTLTEPDNKDPASMSHSLSPTALTEIPSSFAVANYALSKVNPLGSGYICLNGADPNALGENSISLGFHNHTPGPTSIALGHNNNVPAPLGVAIGEDNTVIHEKSAAIGVSNYIYPAPEAEPSFALGIFNTIESASRAFSIGNNNTITANNALAFGHSNDASGASSIAIGTSCASPGEFSVAMGFGLVSAGQNQTVFGRYNIPDPDGFYSLIIGGGETPYDLANMLTLDWDGNMQIAGNLIAAYPTYDEHVATLGAAKDEDKKIVQLTIITVDGSV